jgi:uncharacterized protein (TIGR02284 family)
MEATERNREIISTLHGLIDLLNDGVQGYTKVAERADDVTLKAHFVKLAAGRTAYSTVLNGYVKMLGGDLNTSGEIMGFFHRAWIDLKSNFTSADNASVLAEAINGDKYATDAYEKALETPELTQELRETLMEQHKGIMADTLENTRLKEQYKVMDNN